MLHHALSYIQRGFSIVPLKPGTKVPSPQIKDFYNNPIDSEAKARNWWQGTHKEDGIGIILSEKSGVVCVDLDSNHGATEADLKKLPRTVTVKTRNGFHLYYKFPKQPIKSHVIIPPLDGKTTGQAIAYLRAGNQYVVAPPTVVWLDKDGSELPEWEYKYHGDAGGSLSFYELKQPAQCPSDWCGEASVTNSKQEVYGPNMRHEMFKRTAVAMAAKGKDYEQILQALYERNKHHCQPPKTEAEGLTKELETLAEWATSKVSVKEERRAVAVSVVDEKGASPSVDSEPVVDGETSPEVRSFPDETEKGRRLGTIENVNELLRRLNFTARYNVIKKAEEYLIPGQCNSIDNRANATYGTILSWATRCSIPTGNLQVYLTCIADQNLHNPVANWITSTPWDGKTRLKEFYNTVKSPSVALKEKLMRLWLISAVAAVFEPNGISAQGVLVFQGLQNVGKTEWFKSLAPKELEVLAEGKTLKPDDKDSVYQVLSNWIVELGELDATFKRSDISQLKAFLTKDRDILRRPFCPKESEYARRTVFFGSVNPKAFLNDPTGNRRFWTVPCTEINSFHKIDIQQLWVEVYELYRSGAKWYLTREELDELNEHNTQFETKEPIEEKVRTFYNWDSDYRDWRTASQVLEELGVKNPGMKEARSVGKVLRELNSGAEPRKSMGLLLFAVPRNPFAGAGPALPSSR